MKRNSKNPLQIPWQVRRSALNTELAREVGYITFFWNGIENELDWAFDNALETPNKLRIAVRSSINGLEAKLDIIKASLTVEDAYSSEELTLLRNTLGQFMNYKRLRDAVIHVRIGNIDHFGIAPSFERRGNVLEIMLSLDALTILSAHLEVYHLELHTVQSIIFLRRGARPRKHFPAARGQPDKGYETLLQSHLSVLRKYQAKRKALAPLPEFPQEAELEEVPEKQSKPHGAGSKKQGKS